ncbi:MAG TPA: hypothetical protein VGP72_13975 [Planctomycetota bacterium]
MKSTKHSWKAGLLGLVAACIAFSYAVATTPEPEIPGAATRAANLRVPLQFTNAFFGTSTDRDLGDAAIGSLITRHIAAKGGFPPRRFSADKTNTEFKGDVALNEAIAALPAAFSPSQSTAVVFLDGILKGQIGGPFTAKTEPTPLRFDVTVTDSRGTNPNNVTEKFRITLVDSSVFKFAQSALHDGVAFRQYHEKIEVIGGNPPYTFSASQISVTNNGTVTPHSSLEEIGLFLLPKTGGLLGRPLVPGVVSFMATCTDSDGLTALARDKSGFGQALSFSVADNPRVASELFSTSISIKGDISGGNNDSIRYAGLMDLTGTSLSALKGSAVQLQIGDYNSPVVKLDATGNGGTAKGVTPAMAVSITSDGQIKITVSKDGFGKAGTIITDKELQSLLKILPVEVTVGDAFDASELLKFHVGAKGSKFDLEYKFGPGNLGGGFLITGVAGKDDTKAATPSDAWKVAFVALPQENQKFGTAVTATVGIGTDFTDTINVKATDSVVTSTDKRDPKTPKVLKLAMSAKGKGGLTTGSLPQKSTQANVATDIPNAATSTKKGRFPLIITLNNTAGKEVFGAEGSRAIFPRGSTWLSKNLIK